MTNNNLKLTTETPAEAIIRVNLAKEENVEKFGGRIWNKQRGDGKFAFLGSVVDSANIVVQGHALNSGELNDVPVEVRISSEELEGLQEAAGSMETRVIEVKVRLQREMAMTVLTVRGEPANSIVMWCDVLGCREGSSQLTSDTFETKEDVVGFLQKSREAAQAKRAGYRAGMQMADESVKEGANTIA